MYQVIINFKTKVIGHSLSLADTKLIENKISIYSFFMVWDDAADKVGVGVP